MYTSTRGTETISYIEALQQGQAPDGGLYVPKAYESFSTKQLKGLVGKPYTEVCRQVTAAFVDGTIPDETMQAIIADAYSAKNFPNAVNGNIVPVSEITPGLSMLDLSGGPTAAFKDMALQLLSRQLDHILAQGNEHLTILGATSGDTGSAAEAAFKNLGSVNLTILSPQVGMSAFQRAQMGSLTGGNISNLSVAANFDRCQDMVKQLKADPEFAALGAVNSINWGRIAAQVPYYFSGYLQTVGDGVGAPVDFVVPTGNFGNVLAGYIAREMGLPIRKLIVATNENSVLHRLIQTGEYVYKKSHITSSPSMDISKASNFERLLADLVGRDPERVRQFMDIFSAKSAVSLMDVGLQADALKQRGFDSGISTHPDRIATIKWTYDQSGQVIDPHTADAVTVARQMHEPGVPIVCASTAKAVKFEVTVQEALGFVPERTDARFVDLEKRTEQMPGAGFVYIPDDIDAVKDHLRSLSK